jgi:hypothetical protein
MATFPTVAEVKLYLRNSKPTEDDDFYSSAIDAAVQTLNDECQRNFTVAGVAAARTFVPKPCSELLRVGDFTSLTSVVENGTTLTVSTHHQAEPVTRTNYAGMAIPYDSIRRLDNYWYHYGPRGTVVVTAAWGWTTIPVRIVEASKIITKDIVENRDARAGLINLGEAGLASARMNPTVRATIDKYRSVHSYGLA